MTKSVKIIDSHNFGPVSAKALNEIGIKTIAQLKKKGWKKIAMELAVLHPRFINLNMYRALIGACLNRDWRDVPEKDLAEAKKLIKALKN
jgi:hypothetical protein